MRPGTTFAAAVTVVLATGGPAYAQPDLDCRDFAFQEDAQAEFDRDRSDPHRLDEDAGPDDGIACEALPRRGVIGTATARSRPTRGVRGGVGGGTGPSDFERPLGVALALGALALGVGHVARRRRKPPRRT
jgi:hypothetical protein